MAFFNQPDTETAVVSGGRLPLLNDNNETGQTPSELNMNSVDDGCTETEKQLGKLKRFLKTIFRFAQDCSTGQRDRVKQLIVDLVTDKISAKEFYLELQGSTKFPLRPYVVPFLEAALPALRLSLDSTSNVIFLHKELFGPSNGDFGTHNGDVEHGLKRRGSFVGADGNVTSLLQPSNKRARYNQQSNGSSRVFPSFPMRFPPEMATVGSTPIAADPVSGQLEVKTGHSPTLGHCGGFGGVRRPQPSTPALNAATPTANNTDWLAWQTDDWRNIEVLFTSMVTTMERLRYAMLLFQQRSRLTQLWNEKINHDQRQQDSTLKIEEMQRKADAAVEDVKRAAVNELQKAVQVAEQKAVHMIATERAHMEKLIKESQLQEESSETCVNCGRRAGQTCSGCGTARYCGVFCQHKDWPRHRATCSGSEDKLAAMNATSTNFLTFPATLNAGSRTSPRSV